jgi:hypothetical protein
VLDAGHRRSAGTSSRSSTAARSRSTAGSASSPNARSACRGRIDAPLSAPRRGPPAARRRSHGNSAPHRDGREEVLRSIFGPPGALGYHRATSSRKRRAVELRRAHRASRRHRAGLAEHDGRRRDLGHHDCKHSELQPIRLELRRAAVGRRPNTAADRDRCDCRASGRR